LASMPRAEIKFRLRDRACAEMERLGLHHPPKAPAGFKAWLSGAPAQRFYAGIRDDSREVVRRQFPHWIENAIQDAERSCAHEFSLLQLGEVKLGQNIDWHCDPVTEHTWERLFWTKYDPEHDPEGRDSKIIHDLNRHQHLPRLAKAYFLTGDERY